MTAVYRRAYVLLIGVAATMAVLTFATALALEEGLAGVTMRAVASRIGVAPALVAHYEPNMDELVTSTFRAIVGGELDELGVPMRIVV